ncbi:MAG: hypothetical protein NTW08_08735 [Gammaproteobacteria bacterium]|nr:hypothetical protein [Gammaproteobacteria bacterium]
MSVIGESLRTIGRGIQYLGGGMLFLAAIVGTLIADILILLAMFASLGRLGGRAHIGYFTGLVCGLVLGNKQSVDPSVSNGSSVAALVGSSFIMTAIGFGLALAFAIPHLAIFLAAVWVVSTTVLMMGYGIERLGEWIAGTDTRVVADCREESPRGARQPHPCRELQQHPPGLMPMHCEPPKHSGLRSKAASANAKPDQSPLPRTKPF